MAWLPWTLFAFVAPVKRLVSPKLWGEIWASRREAGAGTFLWIMFISIFVFLSSLSGKVLIYILPMFPPLAFLIGDAMTRLDEKRTVRFWTLIGGLWCVLGVGLIVAGDLLPFPVPMRGMGIAAAVLIICGLWIYSSRNFGNKSGILCSAIALTVWLYPVGLMVAPSLDDAMSPKRQALMIAEYVDKGYAPMAFKIYSGIFTYYAGHDVEETSDWDTITSMVNGAEKIVLSIRERHWEEWKDRPENLTILDHQNIAGMDYLLVIKD